MTDGNERAAQLAEQAAAALAAARTSLLAAAEITDEVDSMLRRGEEDISELSVQAAKVRGADVPGPYLRNVQGFADDIDGRIRKGQRGLDEIRDHLDQSARALNVGAQVLTEGGELPGQQGEAMDRLRLRLEGLRRAVGYAGEGVDEVGNRLVAARRNVEPLVYGPSHTDDPGRAAAVIGEAGENIQDDVTAAHRRLAGLREDFDLARPNAAVAAQQSADLANAARAAMNPTPASAKSGPAGSVESGLAGPSELDLRRRTAAQSQDSARDR